MAKFVQIVEYQTSQPDQMRKLADEWRAATEGKRSTGRVLECADRDSASTYLVIAEFPSYEAAMKNNDLPETGDFAGRMAALADGPPTFRNLDVENVQEG
jgi:hypothetical protein